MAASADLTPAAPAIAWRVATRTRPLHADEACGDAVACVELAPAPAGAPPRCLLAVVDGLGHGLDAATASQAAIDLITLAPDLPLDALMARLETRLLSTRGAAVGLVRIEGQLLQHVGVGNTRAIHLRGESATRLSSQNGIVGGGHVMHMAVNQVLLQPGDWLLLFTDGIDERVKLPLQLPEWRRDPDLLCRHLMSTWAAAGDDAGVLVLHVESCVAGGRG